MDKRHLSLQSLVLLLLAGCSEPKPMQSPEEMWRDEMKYKMTMVIKPEQWELQKSIKATAPRWQMADSVSYQYFNTITDAQEFAKANPDYTSTIIQQ
jgi:hypothetical protein